MGRIRHVLAKPITRRPALRWARTQERVRIVDDQISSPQSASLAKAVDRLLVTYSRALVEWKKGSHRKNRENSEGEAMRWVSGTIHKPPLWWLKI